MRRDMTPQMRRAHALDLVGASTAASNEMDACLANIREAQQHEASWLDIALDIAYTPDQRIAALAKQVATVTERVDGLAAREAL